MEKQKKIGLVVPTYNEEANIQDIYWRLTSCVKEKLSAYDYEILFIDNFSTDHTRELLEELCREDSHVKCIFNARNFGFFRSVFYGLINSQGDCTFLVFADMQDPPELLPQFVSEWEKGNKVVIGIKTKTKENFLMSFFRKCYYKLIKYIANYEQIEHFNGFGLYDKDFIKILRKLEDPEPYLKGLVSELAFRRKEIQYTQEKRTAGKGSTNFFKLYDSAMLGVTSCSKMALRCATFLGFGLSLISLLVGFITLVYKLCYWDTFPFGMAALTVGVFILGGIQLFFIGLLGEYILNINLRVMKRPVVIEEKRINFEESLWRQD